MSFFDRIESCRLPGESLNRFCKRMHIAIRQYKDIKAGGFVRHETLTKMARNLKVSPVWLETGRGPTALTDYENMLASWEQKHKHCEVGHEAH